MQLILGLGSNLGDRASMLYAACQKLDALLGPIALSPVYRSEAMLAADAPAEWNREFYNMCVAADSVLAPRELLDALKEIETSLGRQRRGFWGPREIDIDILAYGDYCINQADMVIPHPGLFERDFALIPFADLTDRWVHPLMQLSLHDILAKKPKHFNKLTKIAEHLHELV